MPAAAVIPAPIAYINVVAVKKLVVGSQHPGDGSLLVLLSHSGAIFGRRSRGALNRVSRGAGRFTLKKLECSEQALHA